MTSKTARCAYADGPNGQVHYRVHSIGGTGKPLVCLHPAPYSGMYFDTLAPLLTKPSVVIAPDYPGYGGSDAPPDLPDIASYAEAVAAVLRAEDLVAATVLGFHTGCLVGVELANSQPEQVAELALVDVPYFAGEERTAMYESAAQPKHFSADVDCLAAAFEFNVAGKLDDMDYARALALFTEQLRPGQRSHWAFHAAFSYDADAAFAELQQPGMIIATQSGLLDATRNAAALLTGLELRERLDITRSVFEAGAAGIAAELNR